MFITQEEARQLRNRGDGKIVLYNAASKKGYAFLNPFHYQENYHIPVPGFPNLFSHSVEAIWQGLKLVNGEIDLRMFDRKPEKRPSKNQRKNKSDFIYENSIFLFERNIIDLVTARHLIYVPSYTFLFEP